MGLVDTLKWLWDPRSEEQKRYEAQPLRCYNQNFTIYIKGIDTPFERYVEFEDSAFGDWEFRIDLGEEVQEWLGRRAEKGIVLDTTWYSPDMIERIEIGKHTVETIDE